MLSGGWRCFMAFSGAFEIIHIRYQVDAIDSIGATFSRKVNLSGCHCGIVAAVPYSTRRSSLRVVGAFPFPDDILRVPASMHAFIPCENRGMVCVFWRHGRCFGLRRTAVCIVYQVCGTRYRHSVLPVCVFVLSVIISSTGVG